MHEMLQISYMLLPTDSVYFSILNIFKVPAGRIWLNWADPTSSTMHERTKTQVATDDQGSEGMR